MFSGVFWPNNTQRIKISQNKSIRNRLILAVGLCGPFVWLCILVGAMGHGVGWFVGRSSSWFKGDKFLTYNDKVKIEKIKALFNN